MNNSLKKSLAGLTLIAIGVAAGWGLAQWRASSTPSERKYSFTSWCTVSAMQALCR